MCILCTFTAADDVEGPLAPTELPLSSSQLGSASGSANGSGSGIGAITWLGLKSNIN